MRHPESPRFAGALAGLSVVALAALIAAMLLVAFGPPAKTSSAPTVAKVIPVADLDNEQLLEALGEPAGAIDCAQGFGMPPGSTGFGWIDQANGRVVVVCVPDAS